MTGFTNLFITFVHRYPIKKENMTRIQTLFIGLLLAALLPLKGWAAAIDELIASIEALPGVTDVKPLESEEYSSKVVFFIDQNLDAHNPAAGKFRQRVIVGHRGYDRPTVMVTEGYQAGYALHPKYEDELSQLLDANVVVVEYRYFDQSMPSPCNWDYLTVENSMYDLHHVRTTLGTLYPSKWMATGISKGGMTTMFYRAFFPQDVAVSVPYVAPLNKKLEDGRHEPFIGKKVSTAENRQRVLDTQLEFLKRKDRLMPMFRKHCEKKKYTFRLPLEEIYDYTVLEYSFAFWQWGTPMEKIPALNCNDATLFKHLISMCEPNYFSRQTTFTSFNVQAAKELGYYGYDTRPFKKYLTIKTSKDYLRRMMLPEELEHLKFDNTLYKKVVKYLKKNDPQMIYIYGEIDPWTASGVTWLKGKQNIKVYIQPGGSHRTRIASFDEKTQKEIIDQINEWMK